MSDSFLQLFIGFLFGISLEVAGFGSPRKLNAQFLLRDFTMFRVMFGAIVVASGIVLLANHFGPSEALPGLIPTLSGAIFVGGFLAGFALVVGGYCPGTALVGIASGKVDALVFFVMIYVGYQGWVWIEPQETLSLHDPILDSRLTLMEWSGLGPIWIWTGLLGVCSAGWWLASRVEKRFHGQDIRTR
jgi:uncharacterized membrane protein YedE/YeeE